MNCYCGEQSSLSLSLSLTAEIGRDDTVESETRVLLASLAVEVHGRTRRQDVASLRDMADRYQRVARPSPPTRAPVGLPVNTGDAHAYTITVV